jgi:hypothetical protein
MEYEYICLHIPTGKQIRNKIITPDTTNKIYSKNDFINTLNNWNRLGGKLWKYWSLPKGL